MSRISRTTRGTGRNTALVAEYEQGQRLIQLQSILLYSLFHQAFIPDALLIGELPDRGLLRIIMRVIP